MTTTSFEALAAPATQTARSRASGADGVKADPDFALVVDDLIGASTGAPRGGAGERAKAEDVEPDSTAIDQVAPGSGYVLFANPGAAPSALNPVQENAIASLLSSPDGAERPMRPNIDAAGSEAPAARERSDARRGSHFESLLAVKPSSTSTVRAAAMLRDKDARNDALTGTAVFKDGAGGSHARAADVMPNDGGLAAKVGLDERFRPEPDFVEECAKAPTLKIHVTQIATHVPLVLANSLGEPAWQAPAPTSQAEARPAVVSASERPDVVKILRFEVEPGSLGVLSVRMRVMGDRVDIRIEAQSETASALLSDARNALISAIEGKGLTLDSYQITSGAAGASPPGAPDGAYARDQQSHQGEERASSNEDRAGPDQERRQAPYREARGRKNHRAPIVPFDDSP